MARNRNLSLQMEKKMNHQVKARATQVFGIALACMALVACGKQETTAPAAAQAATPPAATAAAAEPANVIVWAPPGKAAPAGFAQKLRALKDEGIASEVRVVKEYAFEEKPGYGSGFDELAIVKFPSEAAYEQWKAGPAADLGPDVLSSRVDVMTERVSRKNNPDQSVYVVSQYETFVSPQAYKEYSQDYIDPNMDNQYHSGIMTRYTMYLERQASGDLKNPRAFLVTEYANQAEFDRKASVKDPYKALLLSGPYPEWARLNVDKKTMRRDFNESYARPAP